MVVGGDHLFERLRLLSQIDFSSKLGGQGIASGTPDLVCGVGQNTCSHPLATLDSVCVDLLEGMVGEYFPGLGPALIQHHRARLPVNLRIDFSEPREPKDEVLRSKVCDEEVMLSCVPADGHSEAT